MHITESVRPLDSGKLIEMAPSIGAEKPHSALSERYSFIPTVRAIDYLRDAGWLPIEASQAKTRKKDRFGLQKHLVRFTRPDLVINGHRMDLLLYNSHDGGSSFQLVGGVFRFACANGMVIGDKMLQASYKHVGFSPDKFIASADGFTDRLQKTADVIDSWNTIDLTPDEKNIYAQAAHRLVYDEPEKAPIKPSRLLRTRRPVDKGDVLWKVFNRVQENITRGGLSYQIVTEDDRGVRKTRNATTRPIKSIERDKKINEALWILTEKMAELAAESSGRWWRRSRGKFWPVVA